MFLQNIKINNFRNIQSTNLNFKNGFNIIYGNNGNGKTNLLEAIYYTTSLKPIKKKTKLIHLINENTEHSILSSIFQNNNYKEMIKIIITPKEKSLIYNKNITVNIKYHLHKFQSILFTPDDLSLIKGEPELRRDFFNKSIFHSNQYYYTYIIEYNKILKSRNKILKLISEGNKNKLELLDVLNTQFIDLSINIYNERIKYLIDYIPIFIDTVKKLSQKDFLPYLVYKTDFNYKNKDDFTKKLKKKQFREIQQKRTLIGPHLDDYKIMIDDKELKFFGSQGEIRLFALAMKITHLMYIYQKTNRYPIILLDDISSELDEERKTFLFDFLKQINAQVFITTTSLKNIPELEKANFYNVVKGRILNVPRETY